MDSRAADGGGAGAEDEDAGTANAPAVGADATAAASAAAAACRASCRIIVLKAAATVKIAKFCGSLVLVPIPFPSFFCSVIPVHMAHSEIAVAAAIVSVIGRTSCENTCFTSAIAVATIFAICSRTGYDRTCLTSVLAVAANFAICSRTGYVVLHLAQHDSDAANEVMQQDAAARGVDQQLGPARSDIKQAKAAECNTLAGPCCCNHHLGMEPVGRGDRHHSPLQVTQHFAIVRRELVNAVPGRKNMCIRVRRPSHCDRYGDGQHLGRTGNAVSLKAQPDDAEFDLAAPGDSFPPAPIRP